MIKPLLKIAGLLYMAFCTMLVTSFIIWWLAGLPGITFGGWI